jgi:hypothetical protein
MGGKVAKKAYGFFSLGVLCYPATPDSKGVLPSVKLQTFYDGFCLAKLQSL